MNKNLHRIIFNHKRGQLMAVGETASANGKAAGGQTASPAAPAGASGGGAAWHPLRHALVLAMGALLSVQPAFHAAQAQVIADPSAPGNQRPTVLPAANGVTQVNIQTPSAAGVSRNTYIQFDVPQQGVILNNSRTTAPTQLGGFVQGNPWLAGGGARVILNEVNSSNPSQLRGFVEVAGQRAEVIIANPAGINVNGGGFINASGVTLTTGAPVVNSGNLEAFRVQGGVVNISGSGLDTAGADYTSILARAVQVNAGIWAKDLRVVTGANQVSADLSSATPIAGTGPAPSFALDVAQLGGMYAGKIFIIGTETGLGTRNAGAIGAGAGDIVLQANGWLTNTGSIQAAGQLQATAVGDINNSHLMAAGGNTTLQATGAGAQIVSSANAVIAAGLKADGTLGSSGDLTLVATGNAALNGQTLSAGNAAISAAQLDLTDGKLSGQAVSVTSTAGGIDASRAKVKAQGLLTLTTGQTLRTDGAAISAGQLHLGAADLSNVGGEIVQLGTGNTVITATGAMDNTGGRIASNGNTTISAGSLNNLRGNVQAAGTATLDLTVAGILNNQTDSLLVAPNGQISAGGNATISAGTLANQGALQSGATLALSAADITNAVGSKLTATNTRITVTNSLTNRGLIDGVDTRIDAPTVNNIGTGQIYGDTLSIAATTLNNSAETIAGVTKAAVIAGRDRLDIGAGTLNNGVDALIYSGGTGASALNIGGSLDAARQATGSALAVNNAGGTIESMGGLTIKAAQINNTNPDFAYTVQVAAGPQVKEYVTAQGIYSSNDVAWELGSMTPASHGGYLYAGGQGRFLPKGAAYSDAVYAAYYSGPSPYVAEHSIDTSSGDNSSSIYVPPAFGYLAGHPAWALFGVASPVTAPPGAKPTGTTAGSGDNPIYIPPTPAELAEWEAAIAPWVALQARVEAMRTSVNAVAITFDGLRDYNQSVPSATITRSTPGRFLSAGAMTLNASSALLNDQSQIIAGGVLNITGQALENRGRTPVVDAQRTGRAYAWSNYNEGCGSIKGCDYNYNAYRDSDYSQTVPQTLNLNVYRSDTMIAPASQGVGSGLQQAGTITAGTAATIPAPPLITLPASSLFRTNPNPAAGYLIETDPLFTNLRQWLGSDYMLATLSLDPTVTQKRLGDGFYEQRLVREQVAQLTGLRFLGNFTSDEQQYRALMDAGITFAQQFQLRPGIALSAAQVAQLTSDVLWLVERDVTLPDGSTTKALVPTVYVHTRTGDLNGQGVLLAGREVNINLSGDLTNSGTVAGRTVVSLTAENVHNINGRITGNTVAVAARTDINNIGGTIDAASSLSAIAGRDINIVTTTTSATNRTGGIGSGNVTAVNASSNNTFSMTGIDRVAGLYVTGNTAGTPGTLVASAGRDLNLIAGVIGNNSSSGSTTLAAGNNLNLTTVTTANSSDQRRGDDDFVRDSQTKEIGSQIQTAGSLNLSAGKDLNARAASMQATGDLTVTAGNDANITAGRETNSFGFGLTTSESDLFSSSRTKERRTSDQDNAVSASLGGKTVTMLAGNNAVLEGTQIKGQGNVLLYAGNQLIVAAAQDSQSQSSSFESYKSGLSLSVGAVGAQFGTQGGGTATAQNSTTARGAEITSAQGNASLMAGGTAVIEGARISAEQGTASVQGANVLIQAAVNTSSTSTTRTERGAKIDAIGFSNPSEGIGRKLTETSVRQQTSLARSTLSGQNVNITATQGDLHIAGTSVTTPGTLSLSAAGTLQLDGQQTETVSTLQSFGKDLMYQKMRDQGSIEQTTQYNQFNANAVQFSAPKITAQIGSKDSAQQLAQQPGMEWVEQLLNDPALAGKVNWTTLEDASKGWNYKKQGLTPEGAAIVTIVVAFFTYGAAGTAGGVAGTAVGGGTTGAVVGGAVTAGISALAGQAAVSLINNQGDIGKVLEDLGSSESIKSLLTAMVTAGALQGMGLNPNVPGGDLAGKTFSSQLWPNLKAGVVRSLISTAINGGSLEDSLKANLTSAFIDTAAAQGAEWIGTMRVEGTLNAFTHKLAHALAGCAAGAARAGSEGCAAGAIGAAVGEMAAEAYGKRADTAQFGGMISALAAAVAGGNAEQINLANQAGVNAAANNWLKHAEELQRDALREKQRNGSITSQEQKELAGLEVLDRLRNQALLGACVNLSVEACSAQLQQDPAAKRYGYDNIGIIALGRIMSDFRENAGNALSPLAKELEKFQIKPLVDLKGQITGWAVDVGSADSTSLRSMLGAGVYVGTEILLPTNAVELLPLAGYIGSKIVVRGGERVLVDASGKVIGGLEAKGGVGVVAGNGEGLFTNTTRMPYTPTNPTLGQAFDFSCVAASCKMAANLTNTPEAYVRSAILTDGSGTSLANIPSGLKNLGFTGTADYSAATTIESISTATKNGASVIVNVRTEAGGIHAIVVDSVKGGWANIRDPWPLGTGSSYSVLVDSLGAVLTGKGVVVHP
ncbi:DUF637 domain-containing protein [Polaromonas sp.]|uniref:two-partner secretion domain-containing protein n=1 Tax=Polaromonas sp. TaxID=1869339 RepID=UPI003265E35A